MMEICFKKWVAENILIMFGTVSCEISINVTVIPVIIAVATDISDTSTSLVQWLFPVMSVQKHSIWAVTSRGFSLVYFNNEN